MAESGKFTAAQSRAIAALLEARDIRAAAVMARVGERTLFRWLAWPEFQAALRAAEQSAIDASLRRLAELSGAAVSTLKAVMANEDASPGARVSAANVALGRLLDLREFSQFEERLKALEERIEHGQH